MDTVQTASCIAHLDRIIAELPDAKVGDVVAQWSHEGEQIVIAGLFVGRGSTYFGPARGIRWTCPARSGMFGKGIACYGSTLPAWAASLPRAK